MYIFWITAIIIFVVIEAITMPLVTIWFAIGSVGGLIASLSGAEFWVQLTIFIVISFLLLIFTRPFVKGVLKPKDIKTNADRLVGTTAMVIEEINNIRSTGQVKASGQYWTARTDQNEGNITVSEEQMVKILRIEGVKLIVSPEKQE